jgi:hypothetical protein
MKTNSLVVLIVTLAIGLVAASCREETDVPVIPCIMKTDTLIAPQNLTVEYLLKADGDYGIAVFYYFGSDGMVAISNPVTPYYVSVDLPVGATIHAGSEGSVREGSIEISYKAYNSEINYERITVCSQVKP